MSGGSLDWIYEDVEAAARDGTVTDEQEQVVREIAGVLHDIEWSASGDYAHDRWRRTLAEFCASWSGGYEDSLARKLSPKFDLEDDDTITDMGGNRWRLRRRLYDIDTDERLYEFVRFDGRQRRTIVLTQDEVHQYHDVELHDADDGEEEVDA